MRDSIDRRITSATIAVTVAVADNPGAATLSGTATRQATNGVATFNDLKLNQRGRGYTLRASSGTLVPDTSLTFDVYAPLVVDAVAAAEDHTCALKRGVATYCWGLNTSGQLGDSTTTERLRPVQVKTDQQFDTISASAKTSCGITAAGVAYCWGSNFSGRLGDSTLTDRTSPTLVAGGLTWREVFVGFFHSCGLTTAGKAYCWAYGNTGQLGDSTMPSSSLTPKAVVGGLTFDVLHGRNFHNCGVAIGGTAFCWGTNSRGVLGDSTTVEKAAPQAVYGGQIFLSIVAGFSVSCGIATDAETYCWGSNIRGTIGDSTNVDRLVPTRVHGGHAFVALDAYGFVCGLTGLGAAWCWGSSLASPNYGTTPVAITQLAPLVSISVGFGHACGVTGTGALYCWGDNSNGQLGDGTKVTRNTPVRIVY